MRLRFGLALALPPLLCLAFLASALPAGADVASESSLDRGSHRLELDGRTIHFEVHGEGPPLMVMPNAWGITTTALRSLFRGLEAHRTLVYFDLRGMGESSPAAGAEDLSTAAVREDFEALRRHLDLGAVDALGWSAGATTLLQHALDHPESLRSAVIVHTAARFQPEDGQAIAESRPELVAATQAALAEIVGLRPEERDARVGEFQLEVGFPALFADPEAGRRHLREVFGGMEFSWPHSLHVRQNESLYDLRDRLPELRVPILVIAGAHDILPPERVREIADLAPRARYVLFEESGHFAQLEEPEEFVRVVAEFLAAPGDGAAIGFTEPELRAELLALRERDQELRRARMADMDDEAILEELRSFDRRATARAKEILAEHGWPTAEEVGVDGSGALWLLVQHSPEPEFLAAALPLMKEAASRGDLEPGLVATAVDRVRTHRGEPQLYGTQFQEVDGELVPHPIEDRDHLDERRQEMGLGPFEEYRRLLLEAYGRAPEAGEPSPPEDGARR